MIYLSAFLLGLGSSLHCLGMCGAVAFSLPIVPNHKILGGTLYNFGRITTYAFLGIISGSVGLSLTSIGVQRWVSILSGILILLLLVWKPLNRYSLISKSLQKKINQYLSFQIKQGKSLQTLFLIGLLNGLLPCGVVYFALAGALGTGDTAKGALFMALFGLGTLPMMFALNMGSTLPLLKRVKSKNWLQYSALILAFVFIFRGLGLGIPYLSPKVTLETPKASTSKQIPKVGCCHKKK